MPSAWSVAGEANAAAPWSVPLEVVGPAPIDYQAPVLAAPSRRLVGWWDVQTGSGTVRDPLRGAGTRSTVVGEGIRGDVAHGGSIT